MQVFETLRGIPLRIVGLRKLWRVPREARPSFDLSLFQVVSYSADKLNQQPREMFNDLNMQKIQSVAGE